MSESGVVGRVTPLIDERKDIIQRKKYTKKWIGS